MPVEEGPTDFTPSEFANVAANEGMEAIIDYLAAHGAKPRHIFIVLDIDPAGMPDPEAENGAIAGHGYSGPKELFDELLAHAREVGEEMGVKVNLLVQGHG